MGEDIFHILRMELIYAGLSIDECRLTNLWQHNLREDCPVEWHMTQLSQEFVGRTHILLMGSRITRMMFDKPAEEVSGLKLRHRIFPGYWFNLSVHPASVRKGPIGELKHAIKIFVEDVRNA